jgi:hypothetical protein
MQLNVTTFAGRSRGDGPPAQRGWRREPARRMERFRWHAPL